MCNACVKARSAIVIAVKMICSTHKTIEIAIKTLLEISTTNSNYYFVFGFYLFRNPINRSCDQINEVK